jgi:hypothetical protein
MSPSDANFGIGALVTAFSGKVDTGFPKENAAGIDT